MAIKGCGPTSVDHQLAVCPRALEKMRKRVSAAPPSGAAESAWWRRKGPYEAFPRPLAFGAREAPVAFTNSSYPSAPMWPLTMPKAMATKARLHAPHTLASHSRPIGSHAFNLVNPPGRQSPQRYRGRQASAAVVEVRAILRNNPLNPYVEDPDDEHVRPKSASPTLGAFEVTASPGSWNACHYSGNLVTSPPKRAASHGYLFIPVAAAASSPSCSTATSKRSQSLPPSPCRTPPNAATPSMSPAVSRPPTPTSALPRPQSAPSFSASVPSLVTRAYSPMPLASPAPRWIRALQPIVDDDA